MSQVADLLTAAFNPNLANWSNSPFGCEVERHLLRTLGARFGFSADTVDGASTSGASEANLTALVAALTHLSPEFGEHGLAAVPLLHVFTCPPLLMTHSSRLHVFLVSVMSP